MLWEAETKSPPPTAGAQKQLEDKQFYLLQERAAVHINIMFI